MLMDNWTLCFIEDHLKGLVLTDGFVEVWNLHFL